jgi:hypothetical protein
MAARKQWTNGACGAFSDFIVTLMNPKENNSFARMDATLSAETSSVRRRGLTRLAMGFAGSAAVAGVFNWLLPSLDLTVTPKGLMFAAIPGDYGLVGLMECITGISYRQWARRWDSLKGWQGGVLGLFVACLFFALMALVAAVVL